MPITVGDPNFGSVTITEQPLQLSVFESSFGVVQVSTYGPSGPKGDTGQTGLSGAGEPFYAIISGSLYATTASLAIIGSISSSLIPSAANGFDLGSVTAPWRSLYLGTSSLHFVANNQILSTITVEPGYVVIGDVRIGSESFGFGQDIITMRGNYVDMQYTGSLHLTSDGTNDIVTITSQSTNYVTVDSRGVMVFGSFTSLPTPITGGIIFSGSDFYIGR